MKTSIEYLYPSGVTLYMSKEPFGELSHVSFSMYAHSLSDEPGDHENPTHYRCGDSDEWMDIPAPSMTIGRHEPASDEEAQFLKERAGTPLTDESLREHEAIMRRGMTMEWRDANGDPLEDDA